MSARAQLDRPAMQVHDLLADGQPKPGADSIRFRGKEWLENTLNLITGDSTAGVFDLNRHDPVSSLKSVCQKIGIAIRPASHATRPEHQIAAIWHRLDRIHEQIDE